MKNKITQLALLISLALPIAGRAELYFDINALNLSEEEKSQLDLSTLMNTRAQMPGEYFVKIFLNKQEVGQEKINFVLGNNEQLQPELTISQLVDLGIKVDVAPDLKSLPTDTVIHDLSSYIEDATIDFNFEKMKLELSIPQAFIDRKVRGYISPEKWDDGLPMVFTNYTYTGSKTRNKANDNEVTSHYINLRNGANLGSWRLRNYSYFQKEGGNSSHWNSMKTWVEKDIKSLHSRLSLGEINTSGLTFDSFNFQGVSLSSQEDMLPDSQKGFAPVIRNVALTNATVEVYQKGNLIYQTYVTPGEFVIDDLYPTSSGDLDIKIIEEDGSVRRFTQTFVSAPMMVREGQLKYAVSSGRYETGAKNKFVQGELAYGLLNNTTVYSGIIGGNNYASGLIGVGQGLGSLGAISMDYTYAKATLNNDKQETGSSLRFRYSKSFDQTGTNMTLAGYRYSTQGFYSFDEANEYWVNANPFQHGLVKNKIQLSVNQQLGDFGSIYFSGYRQSYWDKNLGYQQSWAANWNKNFNGISVNVGWNNIKNSANKNSNNIFSLGVNIPLSSLFGTSHSMNLSNNFAYTKDRSSNINSTLTGSLLEDDNLSYSLSQSYSKQPEGQSQNSSSVSLNYNGTYGSTNIKYSNSYGENDALSWGVKGAIVAHPYGLTLAQSLSESGASALVKADGASNVKINNNRGVATDYFGYAIVPYVTAYKTTDIRLNTESLADNVEIKNTIKSVTPTKGALVLADYKASIGHKLFLTLNYHNQKLPLGTTLTDGHDVSGMVNEQGEVYLTGVQGSGTFTATLLNGESCNVSYQENHATDYNGIFIDELECR